MLTCLRFSLFPLLVFPLLYAALLHGGYAGWWYTLGLIFAYLLVDNVAEAPSTVTFQSGIYYNTVLLLHIPFSCVALLLLFWQSAVNHEELFNFASRLHELAPFLPTPTPVTSSLEYWGLVIAVGFVFGHNTAVAHELMHRRSRWLFEASRLLFALCGDAQVVISHIHSHHTKVATAEDPTSARRGDSIYWHFLRAVCGQYRDSLAFERNRLAKAGALRRAMGNQVINGVLLSIIPLLLVGTLVGLVALVSWLVIMLIAKWLLEAINYVQHYGLVRVPGSAIETRHSWESQGLASTLGLYNATRHGGHHVNGNDPFWDLEYHGTAPVHPHGYMYAISLALIPPWWRSYIAPRLSAWDQYMASAEEQTLVRLSLTETEPNRSSTSTAEAK